MPAELNRRALFAAAAAFLVALAVAYALSSTGQASPGTGPPGSPAEPLDVASGIAGQSTLGEAQALPALVRKPKPKPAKKAPEEPGPRPRRRSTRRRRRWSRRPRRAPPLRRSRRPPPQVFADSG